MSQEVEAAKEVLRSHEAFAMQGDLDGVMTNIAEDIVVLASGASLVEGRDAFRGFYGAVLEAGDQEFGHDYGGGESIGDVVVLHGISRGTVTSPEGGVTHFANNFIHALRRDDGGQFKIWRASFAPSE